MAGKNVKVKGLPAAQSLELEKLTRVIGLHLGIGGIFIIAVGNEKIQQRIERLLKTCLEDGIAWYLFKVDNERTDVLLYLRGLVDKKNIEPAKTIISIKVLEDYHPDTVQKILHALNTRREYVCQDKLLCLFWVRPELMEQLQRQAKDFWSFRSYTCKFEEMPSHWRIPAKRPQSYNDRIQEITSLIGRVEASSPLNRGLLASLYFALGEQASKYSDLERALSSFLKAKKLLVQTQDKRNLASTLGNIGAIYQTKGDLDEALRYHQEALKIDREIGYLQGEASQLGNIGLIYKDKGDLDEALRYHQEALKIDREIGYLQGEASDLGNIGLIYKDKGDLDEALRYLQEALKIFREMGSKRGVKIAAENIKQIKEAMRSKTRQGAG